MDPLTGIFFDALTDEIIERELTAEELALVAEVQNALAP